MTTPNNEDKSSWCNKKDAIIVVLESLIMFHNLFMRQGTRLRRKHFRSTQFSFSLRSLEDWWK